MSDKITVCHFVVGALAGIVAGIALSRGLYLLATINVALSFVNTFIALKRRERSK